MNIWRAAALVAVLLGGCTSESTQPVTLKLSDADGSPAANARLICHDDGVLFGTTDEHDVLTLQVPGRNMPDDGFTPDCQVAYFRTDNDQFGRHFWFARFVRGEDVNAKAHSVELIDRGN